MNHAVQTEDRDGVLVITIDRPEARNAVNRAVSEGVAAAMDLLDSSEHLRVAVITGAGNTFCAGMDLKSFSRGETVSLPGRGFAGFVTTPPSKPLIAAVEGYALGGGCEIALACDLIVASVGANFGLTEVKRGLIAAGGGLLRLPERLPYSVAMELALTGDLLTATRAHQFGMVNRLTEDGGALDAAVSLARSISNNGPLAVSATKRLLKQRRDWSTETEFEEQQAITAPVFASNDAREGALAFVEKRPAVWTAT
ncbi:crotonase/enoyl-CoA hydratase family protein [Jatrophihabitans sp.]|uniref:crotonase/enoyl-CoA hydratase family protein n=1 Tax=Jatrophihabitans sp. TaxID=1932789 RepID=UPI0030C6E46D|nr:enoyl-CoA hydratase [Jatrophihabitans sp.]